MTTKVTYVCDKCGAETSDEKDWLQVRVEIRTMHNYLVDPRRSIDVELCGACSAEESPSLEAMKKRLDPKARI